MLLVSVLPAGVMRLVYSAAMIANAVFLVAPLLLLRGLQGGDPSQSEALITYSLRLHAAGFAVALVVFGAHLIVLGLLIARSTFLPRALGPALSFAGLCYMANSLLGFVAPSLASNLFPWILLPGFLAEGTLTLWLLIAGVNVERWTARAASPQ